MSMPAGLPPPRPDQGFAPTGSPMAPGSPNVVRAKQVIVFGVGEGVFVYNGTPALGNPPILAMSDSTTDPFGNAIPVGTVSISGNSYAQLINAGLFFIANATQFLAASVATGGLPGILDLQSGLETNVDTAAEIILQSAQASGTGNEQVIINAFETVINGNITATAAELDIHNGSIFLNMAQPTNYPTAGKTLAQTQACLDALVTSMINRLLVA